MRWSFEFLRARPVAFAVVVVLTLVAVAFSVLIGLPFVVPVFLFGVVGLVTLWLAHLMEGRRDRAPGSLATLVVFAVVGLATFALIQLVPYGRSHDNPPVTGEPQWANAETRALMVRACYSCHSNETEYPWYSNIAPVSWAVQHHIDEGRGAVNYSEFATHPGNARDTAEVVQEGSMPPSYFTALGRHPEAKLTPEETAQLLAGLRATPGLSGGGGGRGRD